MIPSVINKQFASRCRSQFTPLVTKWWSNLCLILLEIPAEDSKVVFRIYFEKIISAHANASALRYSKKDLFLCTSYNSNFLQFRWKKIWNQAKEIIQLDAAEVMINLASFHHQIIQMLSVLQRIVRTVLLLVCTKRSTCILIHLILVVNFAMAHGL